MRSYLVEASLGSGNNRQAAFKPAVFKHAKVWSIPQEHITLGIQYTITLLPLHLCKSNKHIYESIKGPYRRKDENAAGGDSLRLLLVLDGPPPPPPFYNQFYLSSYFCLLAYICRHNISLISSDKALVPQTPSQVKPKGPENRPSWGRGWRGSGEQCCQIYFTYRICTIIQFCPNMM